MLSAKGGGVGGWGVGGSPSHRIDLKCGARVSGERELGTLSISSDYTQAIFSARSLEKYARIAASLAVVSFILRRNNRKLDFNIC